MPTAKTTTLSFRVDPALKDALRIAAQQEHRSLANMVETLIRDHCARQGISMAPDSPAASTTQDGDAS